MGYVPRVAIVGGGVSGLVLGRELAARGIHSTVFDTGEHACGGRDSILSP
jgi:2-polyprenyl-6-methoxyphenol hydroxylase-like FAD-dependent oxidoreductase